MKKAVKGLLKLIGGIMVAAGAVLVVVSYLDELKGLVERARRSAAAAAIAKATTGTSNPTHKNPRAVPRTARGFYLPMFRSTL